MKKCQALWSYDLQSQNALCGHTDNFSLILVDVTRSWTENPTYDQLNISLSLRQFSSSQVVQKSAKYL